MGESYYRGSNYIDSPGSPGTEDLTDLSTEESLLKTIEKSLKKSSKSSRSSRSSKASISTSNTSLKPEDLTALDNLTKSVREIGDKENEDKEDEQKKTEEKCKKGMKKIEDNNVKLDDLHQARFHSRFLFVHFVSR